jgi:hypothetical protein
MIVFVSGFLTALLPTDLDSVSRDFGAHGYGGAVRYNGAGKIFVGDSKFESNTAASGTGGVIRGDSCGGAISVEFGSLRVGTSIPQLEADFDVVVIMSSSFISNSVRTTTAPNPPTNAAASGGAVDIYFGTGVSQADVDIRDSKFFLNSAAGEATDAALGGALGITWDETINSVGTAVSDSVFFQNSASGDSAARGGAIMMRVKSAQNIDAPQFFNVSFLENKVSRSSCQSGPATQCGAGSFVGGAISIHRDGIVFFNIPKQQGLIEGNRFVGNVASEDVNSHNSVVEGGAVSWEIMQEPLKITKSEFNDNFLSCLQSEDTVCRGGAIASSDGVEIDSSFFSSNSVRGRIGPFISAASSDANAGGAIFSLNVLTILNSVFQNHTVSGAVAHGGTIFAASAEVNIRNSRFSGSTVHTGSGNGGVGMFEICTLDLRNSTFSSSTVTSSFNLVGNGGGIAFSTSRRGSLSNCLFKDNSARYGGSIWMDIVDGSVPILSAVTVRNSSAEAGGALFVARVDERILGQLNSLVETSLTSSWGGNVARYGSNFSSVVVRLQVLAYPPPTVFPGQKFNVKFLYLDAFNQTIKSPELFVTMSPHHDTPNFQWNPVRSSTPLTSSADSGLIEFPEIEVVVPPGSNFYFSVSESEAIELPIRIVGCPPGYFLQSSPEEYVCKRCAEGLFNTNGSHACETCPRLEGHERSHSSLCLEEPDRDDENFNHKLDDFDNQLAWFIPKGFFPVPFLNPAEIIPCANPEACLRYNCSLSTMNNSWIMDCSSCSHEARHENKADCHCEPGYQGRLCSACACNTEECYFSYDTEEHSCTICKPHSSPILIGAVVFLQLSMIAFLVFRRSAATLFLAETVLAVILLLLGIGEWYIFNIVSIMALMFLLTSAEKRKSHGNPHDSHAEVAQRTGVIKIILFFVQATPVIVSKSAWPGWVRIAVERLNALNLKISGLECLNPSVFASPVGRFTFVMALPLLLSLSITFAVVLASLFRWANMKTKISRVLPRCCRKSEESAIDEAPPLDPPPQSDSEVDADYDPHVPLLDQDGDHAIVNEEQSIQQSPNFAREVLERTQYAVLFVLFSGYFELSNSILSFLRPCEGGFMHALPFVECSLTNGIYLPLYALSWIFFVIYFLGIPSLFALLLFRNRAEIKAGSHSADSRVGFLYESFRREVFWFEMIWIARRVAISVIISFVERSSARTAALSALLLASIFVGRKFHPFTTRIVNNLETLATGLLFYTYIVGEAMRSSESGADDIPTLIMVMQTSLWILNACFVLFTVGVLVKEPMSRWYLWIRRRICCARR